jgi:hypothetical protein
MWLTRSNDGWEIGESSLASRYFSSFFASEAARRALVPWRIFAGCYETSDILTWRENR